MFTDLRGRPLNNNSEYHRWKALIKAAGVRDETPRHGTPPPPPCCCSDCPSAVIDIMGWSSASWSTHHRQRRKDVAEGRQLPGVPPGQPKRAGRQVSGGRSNGWTSPNSQNEQRRRLFRGLQLRLKLRLNAKRPPRTMRSERFPNQVAEIRDSNSTVASLRSPARGVNLALTRHYVDASRERLDLHRHADGHSGQFGA